MANTVASAVIFAYHSVGVGCIEVLLNLGVQIQLIVTHLDNPNENIWFESVKELAVRSGIDVITPDTPNSPELIERVHALKPDFLFSFYYRHMLPPALLATASRGAFNMHGSLLPKYRGRVPINWAIIKGETETGATLHEMVAKPDAGRIVDQERVSIGPDETAKEVFDKVAMAARTVMQRAIPALLDGTAILRAQDLSQGSYYGGRKPEDGVIDWNTTAENIHNLVRAVAPPYPGATTIINGETVTLTKTTRMPPALTHTNPGFINVGNDQVIALCGNGTMLRLLEAVVAGQPHNELMLAVRLGDGLHRCI